MDFSSGICETSPAIKSIKNIAKCIATQTPPIVPAQTSVQLHNKLDQENYPAEN